MAFFAFNGNPDVPFDDYILANLSGPSSFGSGTFFNASSTTFAGEQMFALTGAANFQLFITPAYLNTALNGMMTFNGADFASLGLTPGSYVWTWSNGAKTDSLTLNIGAPAAVPEMDMTATLLTIGVGGILAFHRRRAAVAS